MDMQPLIRVALLVRSSSGNGPYHVSVELCDRKVTAICDCQAGQHGLHCKHQRAVVKGDKSILHDMAQYPDLTRASDLLSRSQIKFALEDVEAAEDVVEKAKKELKNLRARLGRLMTQGALVDES